MKCIRTSEGLAWVTWEQLKQVEEAPVCISKQGLYRGVVGPAQKCLRHALHPAPPGPDAFKGPRALELGNG